VEAALSVLGERRRRVLDFGCNVGAASRILAHAGHDVVGVDISMAAVRRARDLVPDARFDVVTSESRLPFADGCFDACFSSEVIEHLFDVRGWIREIHRVLVQDGLLLITTPYHGWLKNVVIATLCFDKHYSPHGEHIRFFSRTSLRACLEEGGFQVHMMQGIGRTHFLWKSIFVAARRR
jgi:SAM-dependent methyltransferase